MTDMRFRNRMQAGELLAEELATHRREPDAIVLALPRGGVPVGFAVARALQLPLDVMLVRKLGVPGHEELAMGAIAGDNRYVVRSDMVQMLGISNEVIEAVTQREQREMTRREALYRAGRPPLQLEGRSVILVDDGLATGSTMLAAVRALRSRNPARVIVAVPVASVEACSMLRDEADEMVCLRTPEPFRAVSLWYQEFSQTEDDEVIRLLAQAEQFSRSAGATGRTAVKQADGRQ